MIQLDPIWRHNRTNGLMIFLNVTLHKRHRKIMSTLYGLEKFYSCIQIRILKNQFSRNYHGILRVTLTRVPVSIVHPNRTRLSSLKLLLFLLILISTNVSFILNCWHQTGLHPLSMGRMLIHPSFSPLGKCVTDISFNSLRLVKDHICDARILSLLSVWV